MSILTAKKHLLENNLTCVITDDKNIVYTSYERGVTPLVIFILKDLKGNFYLADKVIGKAAAYLCVKANIKHVFTTVISYAAIKIFKQYNISYEYEQVVSAIQNRNRDGNCPMEQLAVGVEDYNKMFDKVYAWLIKEELI